MKDLSFIIKVQICNRMTMIEDILKSKELILYQKITYTILLILFIFKYRIEVIPTGEIKEKKYLINLYFNKINPLFYLWLIINLLFLICYFYVTGTIKVLYSLLKMYYRIILQETGNINKWLDHNNPILTINEKIKLK